MFLRVNVRKIHAYLRRARAGHRRGTLHQPFGEIARTPSVRHFLGDDATWFFCDCFYRVSWIIKPNQRCGYSDSPFARKDTFLHFRVQKGDRGDGHVGHTDKIRENRRFCIGNHKIRVCTVQNQMSRKITDSRQRPTQQASLVSFNPFPSRIDPSRSR